MTPHTGFADNGIYLTSSNFKCGVIQIACLQYFVFQSIFEAGFVVYSWIV